MNTHSHHRHALALPVFVAVLTGMFITTSGLQGQVGGSVEHTVQVAISATDEDKPVRFAFGAGTLAEDSRLLKDGNDLTLEDGVLELASNGVATVTIGDIRLSGVHGAFVAERGEQTISVLALTTPVLVARGEYRFVVPAGMEGEWDPAGFPDTPDPYDVAKRVGTLLALPEEFLRDELVGLRSAQLPPLPAFDESVSRGAFAEFLELPVATERRERENRLRRLQSLRDALESGDGAAARTILREPLMQEALAAPDLAPETLATLLILSRAVPSVTSELTDYLRDSDLWLLLSFHPEYRLAAWSTPGPLSVTIAERMLRWLQFPSSDSATDGAAAATVRAWEVQVSKYLAANKDDAPMFLHLLLSSMNGYRQFVEDSDLPERLQRYSRALQKLVPGYEGQLSAQAQEAYAAWKDAEEIPAFADIPPAPEPAISSVEPPPSAPQQHAAPEPFNAPSLESDMKKLLQTSGALFLTTTSIHAEAANAVAVGGVMFVSGGGEHLYDFTFNPKTRMVSKIERDREISAFSLSYDAFVKWAKGE